MNTPVGFFIFNRPETTECVFNEIVRAKPPMLLVVADGPRADRPGEAERCARTRALIERVDWPCDVRTNYADGNMGCRRRLSSGLDWIFNMVEEAIILEDDCVPHPTFFSFCEELLETYRDDERVAHISGTNFFFGEYSIEESYYFAQNPLIWGWASWRRAWRYYDVAMSLWPSIRDTGFLRDFRGGEKSPRVLRATFENIYQGKVDTWDYQWVFACLIQHGLAVTPGVNLVSNIGFSGDATHATEHNKFADMPVAPMMFPLCHPRHMIPDPAAAAATRKAFATSPLVNLLYLLPPSVIHELTGIKQHLTRRTRRA